MAEAPRHLNMLLVEEQNLLRKTVSLTARSLGLGTVHEAATVQAAIRQGTPRDPTQALPDTPPLCLPLADASALADFVWAHAAPMDQIGL